MEEQQNYGGQAPEPVQPQQVSGVQANAAEPVQPQQVFRTHKPLPAGVQANAAEPVQPQQVSGVQANAAEPVQPQQVSGDLKFNTNRPMKPKELAGKEILFPTNVYDNAERSKLLFTSDLTESKDLGTAEIRYTKPRGKEQPFLIIKFENEKNSIGVMMGDIKEAKKAWTSSPDPMFAIKEPTANDKILGYKLNPSAKFAWNREKRELLVS